MSLWSDTCELVSHPSRMQDEAGAWHDGEPQRTTVFCDRWSTTLSESDDPSRGLVEVAQLLVRYEEYGGEDEVAYRDHTYSVASTADKGQFKLLRIERRVGDGD